MLSSRTKSKYYIVLEDNAKYNTILEDNGDYCVNIVVLEDNAKYNNVLKVNAVLKDKANNTVLKD